MGASDRIRSTAQLIAGIPDGPVGEQHNQLLREIVMTMGYQGVQVVADSAARDALFPTPQGDEKTLLKDTGALPRYDSTLGWVTALLGASSVPTLEELAPCCATFSNAAIAATTTIPLWSVAFAQRVGAFSLAFSTGIAVDAANYWTFSLQYIRAGRLPVQITSQTTQTGSGTTAGQPIVANQPFGFDKGIWPASLRYLRRDDFLQIVATKTGTPANLTNGVATLRYEPNLIVPIRDSFSRIDSATLLGTSETGHAWTAMSQPVANTASVWGIKTGQAAIQVHSNQGRDYANIDAGYTDVSISAVLLSAAAAGLTGRMVAGNTTTPRSGFLHNATAMFREDAGVLTGVITFTDTLINNDTLTLEFSADQLLAYRNGVKIGGVFDTNYMTSTLHGLRNTSGTVNTGLIDDFIVVPL